MLDQRHIALYNDVDVIGLKPEAGIEIKICKINQKKILNTFGAITSRLL